MRLAIILPAAVFAVTSIFGCSSGSEEDVATNESEIQCAGACSGGSLSGDRLLTPVDKRNGLRSDWAPSTVPLRPNYVSGANWEMRQEAKDAFEAMAKAAYDTFDGGQRVDLYCVSGYRSFATQCSLFSRYAASDGCEEANTYSAHAGHSEHQLGTVCDVGFAPYLGSAEPFVRAGDAADRWLSAHAWEYGFACSYPNANASQNDGYIHEPWHYRFVGKAAAAEIHRRGRPSVPVFIASLSEAERDAFESGDTPPPSPPPPPPPSGGGCGDLTAGGRCVGTVLEWCKNGQPKSVDCATTANGYTACGLDPNPANGHNCVVPSPCLGYSESGTCTGSVLEWCKDGTTYARVDCATKQDGRTACGADPNPALGMNCVAP
jgi:D-alanyl-D-alanine carboxypeptidase